MSTQDTPVFLSVAHAAKSMASQRPTAKLGTLSWHSLVGPHSRVKLLTPDVMSNTVGRKGKATLLADDGDGPTPIVLLCISHHVQEGQSVDVVELRSFPSRVRDQVLRLVLSFRERRVFELLHGFFEGDDNTYAADEVARIFRATASDIAEIESNALQKLAKISVVQKKSLSGMIRWMVYRDTGKRNHAELLANITTDSSGDTSAPMIIRTTSEVTDRYEGEVNPGIDDPAFSLLIDPGTASNEDIAELLYEMSKLYRMVGGSGIQFDVIDSREAAPQEAVT